MDLLAPIDHFAGPVGMVLLMWLGCGAVAGALMWWLGHRPAWLALGAVLGPCAPLAVVLCFQHEQALAVEAAERRARPVLPATVALPAVVSSAAASDGHPDVAVEGDAVPRADDLLPADDFLVAS